MSEQTTYPSVLKRNQSKVVRPLSLSTTQPEQPHKFMIIANAVFYNGQSADRIFYNGEKVWEKATTPPTPPTPTYGSNVLAGKFTDSSTSTNWKWWPNQGNAVSITNYVDPDTKEFNLEYDGTLTKCRYLFNGNGSNAKFERIDHIPDTSGVSDMFMMFANNNSLLSVNVSDLNTSNVTNMGSMFTGCGELEALDLSGFDTSKVANMGMMFYNCTSLATLILTGWNFNACTTSNAVFYGCTSLTTIIGPVYNISTNLDLSKCPLTADSAMVIVNGLANVSSAKTISLKASTYDELTAEQIAVATQKGWAVTRI